MQALDCSKCAKYFARIAQLNGESLCNLAHNHIMILYFAVHGLDVLNSLEMIDMRRIRQYVLGLQCKEGGFNPSSFYSPYPEGNPHEAPHIVFTYSALNILNITGGIDQVDRQKCLLSVQRCAKPNGSYSSFQQTEEADLRFVYAAVCICKHLEDFSKMDKGAIIQYISSCRNFDGGYGLRPNCESHGGAIYCALASLSILEAPIQMRHLTLNFLVNRQVWNQQNHSVVGVQGRVGKTPDSCYTFWNGASIAILTGKNLLSPNIENFLALCCSGSTFRRCAAHASLSCGTEVAAWIIGRYFSDEGYKATEMMG